MTNTEMKMRALSLTDYISILLFIIGALLIFGEQAYAKEDPMNNMSVPEDVCVVAPGEVNNRTPYFDVATHVLLDGPREEISADIKNAAEPDVKAITLARAFQKASRDYRGMVSMCRSQNAENFNNENIMRKCECGAEAQLLTLKDAYITLMEAYPQARGSILRIPRQTHGYEFAATKYADPAVLSERCAIYLAD